VNPYAKLSMHKLSMHMHHHRAGHWVEGRGTAKVTAGDVEKLVRQNKNL
jgi:mannose-1-phosphate guanylyltransferase